VLKIQNKQVCKVAVTSTRKPCCRKGPRDVAAVVFGLHVSLPTTFTTSFTVAKLRKSGFRAPHVPAQNRISHKMAILGHVFWTQWKGDKGISNNKY